MSSLSTARSHSTPPLNSFASQDTTSRRSAYFTTMPSQASFKSRRHDPSLASTPFSPSHLSLGDLAPGIYGRTRVLPRRSSSRAQVSEVWHHCRREGGLGGRDQEGVSWRNASALYRAEEHEQVRECYRSKVRTRLWLGFDTSKVADVLLAESSVRRRGGFLANRIRRRGLQCLNSVPGRE